MTHVQTGEGEEEEKGQGMSERDVCWGVEVLVFSVWEELHHHNYDGGLGLRREIFLFYFMQAYKALKHTLYHKKRACHSRFILLVFTGCRFVFCTRS